MAYVQLTERALGLATGEPYDLQFGDGVICGVNSVLSKIPGVRSVAPLTPKCQWVLEHQDLLKAQQEGRYPLPPQSAPPVVPPLTAGGYTKATVDDIIAATKARQDAQMREFFGTIRGEGEGSGSDLWLYLTLGVIALVVVVKAL